VLDLLELHAMCKEYHSLPTAGGIHDQDHLLMRKLFIVMAAIKEKEAKKKSGSRGT
jgi:hypothetical protein